MRLPFPAFARRWLTFAVLVGTAMAALAQFSSQSTQVARSVSGQFVVLASRNTVGSRIPVGTSAPEAKLLQVEPAFVTVSGERIKQALAEELGLNSVWVGKIYVSLPPAITTDDQVLLTCERFRDGWNYRLDVPNPVEPTRYVRAMVQTLLLEQANRGARTRAAEVPLWLSEGLLQQILATRGAQVLLAPPKLQVNKLQIRPTVLETRGASATTLARLALGQRRPLSLDELSWPKENQLDGPEGEVYRVSAQWFVAELLNLPDGAASLQTMLRESANCLNWQTAFLRGFHRHFERLLDAEKWWSLTTAHVEGTEPGKQWTPEESWARLEEILEASAEVRQVKDELPQTARVSLASVIRDWEFNRQLPILNARITELALARQRVAPEFLPLVDQYRVVLSDYLARRERAALNLTAGKANTATSRSVTRGTLKALERLNQLRLGLKPVPNAPATTTAAAPAAPQSP